ncbi:DUF4440 domain-containing protein [Sediminicola luteus]|nr:DUF4440 domain-containing protein [Sediminicola luteus]
MKRRIQPIGLIVFVALLVIGCGQGNGVFTDKPSRVGLLATLDTFNLAFEKADVKRLDALVSDGYVHTNGSWAPIGKKEWLGYIQQRKNRLDKKELHLLSYQVLDTKVHCHNTMAIVTSKVEVTELDNGLRVHKAFRVTQAWSFKDGQWKRVAFQDTPIAIQ